MVTIPVPKPEDVPKMTKEPEALVRISGWMFGESEVILRDFPGEICPGSVAKTALDLPNLQPHVQTLA